MLFCIHDDVIHIMSFFSFYSILAKRLRQESKRKSKQQLKRNRKRSKVPRSLRNRSTIALQTAKEKAMKVK